MIVARIGDRWINLERVVLVRAYIRQANGGSQRMVEITLQEMDPFAATAEDARELLDALDLLRLRDRSSLVASLAHQSQQARNEADELRQALRETFTALVQAWRDALAEILRLKGAA